MEIAMLRSKWFLPLLSVALGGVFGAALWVGGQPGEGLFSLALMTGLGLLILTGAGSETVRGLRGDGRDERFRMMDVTATAFAGTVLIVVVLALTLVELARGHDGNPYARLAALAGVAYLAGVAWIRWRS